MKWQIFFWSVSQLILTMMILRVVKDLTHWRSQYIVKYIFQFESNSHKHCSWLKMKTKLLILFCFSFLHRNLIVLSEVVITIKSSDDDANKYYFALETKNQDTTPAPVYHSINKPIHKQTRLSKYRKPFNHNRVKPYKPKIVHYKPRKQFTGRVSRPRPLNIYERIRLLNPFRG